jgi:hypothetical protein
MLSRHDTEKFNKQEVIPSAVVVDDPAKQAQELPQPIHGGGKTPSYFFDHSEGIYFTFTAQQLKISACRAVLKICMLAVVFVLYYLFWNVCDSCVLVTAVISCAASCVTGMDFTRISCAGGATAVLLKGIRVGSKIAHIDIKYDV